MSSYSSNFWAQNAEEKRASITSPLDACNTNGRAIFVPIVADILNKSFIEIAAEAEKVNPQAADAVNHLKAGLNSSAQTAALASMLKL